MAVAELLERAEGGATRATARAALEEARSRALYLRTYAANGRVPITSRLREAASE